MLVYETEALATEAEAETKAFSVETEARSMRLKFQPRQDRAEALLRLETASRPRRQDRDHVPDARWTRARRQAVYRPVLAARRSDSTVRVHVSLTLPLG